MFDFSTATIVEGGDYVQKPGYYKATISEVKLFDFAPGGGTPYLSVIFDTAYGKLTEKFWITPAALGRLRLLFQGVWNKDLVKQFASVEEVGGFFVDALMKKPTPIGIRVMTDKVGEKTYSKLSYNNFIYNDLEKFTERVVEQTDADQADWYIVKTPRTTTSSDTIIKPETTANTPEWAAVANAGGDESDDLPF